MTPPVCAMCGGVPGANVAACQECARYRDRAIAALGGLRPFNTYVPEGFNPVTNAAKLAYSAAKAFNPRKDNLYLHGPTGAGKTRLAAIAARGSLPQVITATSTEMICTIMENRRGLDELAEVRRYATSRVLVLDEVGRDEGTENQISKVYAVVNHRYNNKPGGLIVTSNLGLDDLAKAFGDDRICSRLFQMCQVFDLTGEPDHRMDPKQ